MDRATQDVGLRLSHARQQLAVAYERARAVGYQQGSQEMEALQAAEDGYQQTQRLWQDVHRRSSAGPAAGRPPGPAGPGTDAGPEQQTDTVVDLTGRDEQVDLTGRDEQVDLDYSTSQDAGC